MQFKALWHAGDLTAFEVLFLLRDGKCIRESINSSVIK